MRLTLYIHWRSESTTMVLVHIAACELWYLLISSILTFSIFSFLDFFLLLNCLWNSRECFLVSLLKNVLEITGYCSKKSVLWLPWTWLNLRFKCASGRKDEKLSYLIISRRFSRISRLFCALSVFSFNAVTALVLNCKWPHLKIHE